MRFRSLLVTVVTFVVAGYFFVEAAPKVKQGVDLTGMVKDTDGQYAYPAVVDWSRYEAIVFKPFLISNKKKKYKGITAEEGEEMLIDALNHCPWLKNESSRSDILLLEGRIAEFKTGSMGKRFWVGMGAGKGAISVYAELKDATTGEVVLKYFNRTQDTGDITVRKNMRVMEVLMKRQGKHLCNVIGRAKNGELKPTI